MQLQTQVIPGIRYPIHRLPPQAWGAQSKVVDSEGNLLPVFRGQHGLSDAWTETEHGSLSFGSVEAASAYATQPNDRRHTAQAPKVFPVYLDIRNPFLESDSDPFVDLNHYANAFGMAETVRVALKFKDHVYNTNAWEDVSTDFDSVESLVKRKPKLLLELCFQLFVLLDDPAEVARLRAKGFDGAIYGGSGETALETEYRVFSPHQVRSVWDTFFLTS
ncbi:hypothetical protein G3A43_07500 [Paraburkholderia aspalathi]|nr:hypothetical protein [Paraburkholderia aspalathi]MBK3780099.1 hypothetical protein [Paraburkholderia aspalathi]